MLPMAGDGRPVGLLCDQAPCSAHPNNQWVMNLPLAVLAAFRGVLPSVVFKFHIGWRLLAPWRSVYRS